MGKGVEEEGEGQADSAMSVQLVEGLDPMTHGIMT